MSVCFIAGAVVKALQVSAFTLVWTHSVEKTDWEEDWRITRDGLMLVEARVKGSGAGIDPPTQARLVDGWWRWAPSPVSRSEVVLANSGAVPDWRICTGGTCAPLHATIGVAAGTEPVIMQRCWHSFPLPPRAKLVVGGRVGWLRRDQMR